MAPTIHVTDSAPPQARHHAELRSALERLPQQERLVLALSYQEDLTLQEIGQVLDLPELVVHQVRTRALHMLRLTVGPATAALLPR